MLREVARHSTGAPGPSRAGRSRYRRAVVIAVVLVLAAGAGVYVKMSASASPAASASARQPVAGPAAATSAAPPEMAVHRSGTEADPAPAANAATPESDGARWLSGVSYPQYDPDGPQDADASTAFGTWRGKPTSVVVTYPGRQTWSDFTEPNAAYTEWAKQPYRKVFSIPPVPGDASIGGCLDGSYDSDWQTFARTMVSTGLAAQHTIIRLGWEFNLHTDWGTPAQFARCFAHVVTVVRAIAPGLQWDWNPNRGSGSAMPGAEVLQAYPGNAYVDYIGLDSYDNYPPATHAGGFNTELTMPYGIDYWLNFAKQHGKLMSFPEWGLTPLDVFPGASGGDDPAYIQDMYDFFKANANYIGYESIYCDQGFSLYNPDDNPNAAARYKSLWG